MPPRQRQARVVGELHADHDVLHQLRRQVDEELRRHHFFARFDVRDGVSRVANETSRRGTRHTPLGRRELARCATATPRHAAHRGAQVAFKKGIGAQESRRKREATSVQLRKDKKEDSLQKRRRDQSGAKSDEDRQVGALPDPQHKKNLETIPADIIALNSDEPQTQLDAATRFRKLLSIERNPPIAEVIAAGAVPRLVQFLQCYDNQPLLFEAVWALTNISSGTSEHTRVVIDNGAVPIFCFLLQYSNHEVQEQAVWALATSPATRRARATSSFRTRCRSCSRSSGTKLPMLRNVDDLQPLPRQAAPSWDLVAVAIPRSRLILSGDDEVRAAAARRRRRRRHRRRYRHRRPPPAARPAPPARPRRRPPPARAAGADRRVLGALVPLGAAGARAARD